MARYANVKVDDGIVLGLMTVDGPLHTPNDGCAFVLLHDGQACEPGWAATKVQMPLPENEVGLDWSFTPRPPMVSKVRFKFFLWTAQEWGAALARKANNDRLRFYIDMLEDPALDRSGIDLAEPKVQEAINYILETLAPDVVPAAQKEHRFTQILKG